MVTSPTMSSGTSKSHDPVSKLRIERTPSRAPQRGGSRLLRGLLATVLILGLAVGGLVIAVRNEWLSAGEWVAVPEILQARPEVRLAVLSVETGRAADATVVATGYLESRRQAKIGARAPGRIEAVHVEEGTPVEQGQVLAVLEHADLDASLAAAEATLARTKAELGEHEVLIQQYQRAFARAEQLLASQGVSDTEYDEAKFNYEGAVARLSTLRAAVELAEARVREAQQMRANMFILAPFSGTVISKDAEVGESILPGGMGEASGRGSVVTVADLEHLEVDCDVKEDYISRIEPGQAAEVAVDAVPDRRYRARVRKIIPMGDRARATIKVKVEILNVDDRLFPDMSATVYFLPASPEPPVETAQRRVFCSAEAVQSDDQGSFVWIIGSDQRLQRRAVETGETRDGRTEISAGLEGNERVAIAPPDVHAGQLVKPAK